MPPSLFLLFLAYAVTVTIAFFWVFRAYKAMRANRNLWRDRAKSHRTSRYEEEQRSRRLRHKLVDMLVNGHPSHRIDVSQPSAESK